MLLSVLCHVYLDSGDKPRLTELCITVSPLYSVVSD